MIKRKPCDWSPSRPTMIAMETRSAVVERPATMAKRIRDGRTKADTAIDMAVEFAEGVLPLSQREGVGNQTLPKMSVPFVPPKPNEFFTATLMGMLRAAFAQ